MGAKFESGVVSTGEKKGRVISTKWFKSEEKPGNKFAEKSNDHHFWYIF